MLPNPRMPSVRPNSPCALAYSFLFHCPARRSATLSGDAPVEREDQREGELGDGNRVLARDSSTHRCRGVTRQ
mgnify:CR=1 FL=1